MSSGSRVAAAAAASVAPAPQPHAPVYESLGFKVTDHASVKWTDERPDLDCPICFSCVFNPPNLNCSHLACRACVEKIADRKCPTCRLVFPSASQLQTVRFVQQQIFQRKSACPHKDDGCNWAEAVGTEYRSLIQHATDTCEYRRVRCKQCRSEMPHRDWAAHVDQCPERIIECQHCHETIKYTELVNHQQPFSVVKSRKKSKKRSSHVERETVLCTNMEMCKLGCQTDDGAATVLLTKNAQEHYSNSCPNRPVDCPCCSKPKKISHSQLMDHVKSVVTAEPNRVARHFLNFTEASATEIASLKEELRQLRAEKAGADPIAAQLEQYVWRFPLPEYRTAARDRVYSEEFKLDNMKWRILCMPKGNPSFHTPDRVAAYLELRLPEPWYNLKCDFKMRILHPSGDETKHLPWRASTHTFSHSEVDRGFNDLLTPDNIDEFTFPDGNVAISVTARKVRPPPAQASSEDDD